MSIDNQYFEKVAEGVAKFLAYVSSQEFKDVVLSGGAPACSADAKEVVMPDWVMPLRVQLFTCMGTDIGYLKPVTPEPNGFTIDFVDGLDEVLMMCHHATMDKMDTTLRAQLTNAALADATAAQQHTGIVRLAQSILHATYEHIAGHHTQH